MPEKLKQISIRIPIALDDALWKLKGERKIPSIQASFIAGGWWVVDHGGIPDYTQKIKEIVREVKK